MFDKIIDKIKKFNLDKSDTCRELRRFRCYPLIRCPTCRSPASDKLVRRKRPDSEVKIFIRKIT